MGEPIHQLQLLGLLTLKPGIFQKLQNFPQIAKFFTNWRICHKLLNFSQIGEFVTNWRICHKLHNFAVKGPMDFL